MELKRGWWVLYPRQEGGCSSLDTLKIALVYIFSLNFSHSQANQRTSILKECKKIKFFLKPQYKVYRGASILYFNASNTVFSLFFKNISNQGQNLQMVNSVVYHPCPYRLASRLTLIFIRHLTLINSKLIKQKKLAFSFE